MKLFETISNENRGFYGTKSSNITSIVINQYNDRTHFIFELLQNAEDAGAEKVSFQLHKDFLIIEHDGNDFNEMDIRSICAIGESSKAKDNSGIGKFGIGFKSVYAYTKTPCIYSGDYNFVINDCIFPEEIPAISHDNDITVIKLPFNHDEVSAVEAFDEISSALEKQLTETSVLMLNNITTIEINICDSFKAKIKTDREVVSEDRKVNTVKVAYYKNNTKMRAQSYYQFTDNEKYASSIMFRYDGNNIIKTDPKDNYVYSYFPTSVESHQNFLIQAPFNTTPARDNIKLNERVNIQFVENICRLIEYSFLWLRDKKKITLKALNDIYPMHKYDGNSIFSPLYCTGVNIIRSEKILPTNKTGEYAHIDDVYVPNSRDIVDVVDDFSLGSLYMKNVYWVDKDITITSNHSFYQYLDSNFNLNDRRLRLVNLVEKMDARFMRARDVSWFVKLFSMITNIPAEFKGKIKSFPFVRLSTGEHIVPFDNKGNELVYLNNPKECELKIHDDFRRNNEIIDFYNKTLGLEEYNIVNFVLDKVLTKYLSEKNSISFFDNISDIKQIVNAIKEDSTNRVINKVKDSYIIMSENKWNKPSNVRVPNEFSKFRDFLQLFVKYSYTNVMDEKYFTTQNELGRDDFVLLGCNDDAQYRTISHDDYLKYGQLYNADGVCYKKMQNKYYYICDNLDLVLKCCDKKTSEYIARYFNEKMKSDDGIVLSFYDNNKRCLTTLGLFLNCIPWMYTAEGVKKAPCEIKKEEIDDCYRNYRYLIDSLSFAEVNSELREMLEECVPVHLKEMILRILDNPEESKEVEKLFQKRDRKRGKSITSVENPLDALDNLVKTQKGDGNGIEGYDPEPIHNPEKRKTKAQKEFEESCQKKISVMDSSSLRFTVRFMNKTNSKEEREFLMNQYAGRCQICDDTIVDYKNNNYFEAINIISTDNIPEEYKESVRGWNSLSLCPNCAAKMRVCSKDLSDFSRQVFEFEMEQDYDEYVWINIILKGEIVKIKYTPKHFTELQAALEYFKKNY